MSTKSRAYLLFVQDQCQIVISVKNTQTYMRKKNELFIFRMSRLKYYDIFDQTDPGRKCISLVYELFCLITTIVNFFPVKSSNAKIVRLYFPEK